jgi:D-alanine-D-alanine ligase
MNKIATKKVVGGSGLATPPYREIDNTERAEKVAPWVEAELGLPVMMKPVAEGSSLGVTKCGDRQTLQSAIDEGRDTYGAMFAERYVPGREITVGVLQRGDRVESLPILELVPKNDFYDYEAKYTEGMTEFILPARLAPDVYDEAGHLAVATFDALGCRGYARVDMIVDEKGAPWLIEVNTLPGMTDTSDLPAQALAAGISYEDLVETILLTAVA